MKHIRMYDYPRFSPKRFRNFKDALNKIYSYFYQN